MNLPHICTECGNEEAEEGQALCMECLILEDQPSFQSRLDDMADMAEMFVTTLERVPFPNTVIPDHLVPLTYSPAIKHPSAFRIIASC